MSKENKTTELKDEHLEQVSGGGLIVHGVGKCGNTPANGQCQQYDSSNTQCKTCVCKPKDGDYNNEKYGPIRLH